MPSINMKMTSSSPPSNRSLEKILETAEYSGTLSLVNRRLKEIGQLVFKYDFTSVTELDLSRNRLNEIPPEIFEWQCIDSLTLSHNSIKTISDFISELKLLVTLDLSNNSLTVIPTQICELQHLTIIRLSSNKLISLPEEIGKLKKCQELDISANDLTSIPKQIGQMSSLLYLNIRRNNIFALPEEISTLQLTHLDAGCNLITSVPVSFQNMADLLHLVLDNNPLSSPQLLVLRKGKVHLFRELAVQAEKAQIKKEVMDDHTMSSMNRNSIRSDVSLIEVKARALPITEIAEETAEKRLEKAADLSKGRPKASISSTSLEKKPSHPKKEAKPSPKNQKSAENLPSSGPPKITHPKPSLKNAAQKEQKRSVGSGNFERKSSTEALLIHQKLAGFPGYKPTAGGGKIEPSANGKPPGGEQAKENLHGFVKSRQALSPTDRNNQVSNTKTAAATNVKKGFIPSTIKPRSAFLNRMRGNSFTNSDKDTSFTVRRKNEKLHEELELKESIRQNIESRLKITLGDDLPASLSDGVVLCHLTNHARPRSISMIHVPSPAVPKLALPKRRRNVDNFLDASAKIGVPRNLICSAQDILLEKNISKVAATVSELVKFCPNSVSSPKRQVETPSVRVAPSTLTKQQSLV